MKGGGGEERAERRREAICIALHMLGYISWIIIGFIFENVFHTRCRSTRS